MTCGRKGLNYLTMIAPNCSQQPFIYTTELATCQSPTSLPLTNGSKITPGHTHMETYNNRDFPTIMTSLRDIKPLLFRVVSGLRILGDSSMSAYLYIEELNNTGTSKLKALCYDRIVNWKCIFVHTGSMLTELNETFTIPRPGGNMCTFGFVMCINGRVYSECFNISYLPPDQRLLWYM